MLPVEKSSALRQLVPDRAGAFVLIAQDERELVPRSPIGAFGEQRVDGGSLSYRASRRR
jgi:hypothetical protein